MRFSFCLYSLLPLVAASLLGGCKSREENAIGGLSEALDTKFEQLHYSKVFSTSSYTGHTYLDFMDQKIFPAMKDLAQNGYSVGNADAMETAYNLSDTKVQKKVDSLYGGLDKIKDIASQLEGKNAKLSTLPAMIHSIDADVDQWGLSTFVGLASGGGVAIKYASQNYALNIHYDSKEQKSGRSYGTGPGRGANDASDKQYLDDLESYTTSQTNLVDFYENLLLALTNTDTSKYSKLNAEGQSLLTDFLAVYTAEQARNLMDGKITQHWDAALLEVTLLAAFHAGQDHITLYYKNPADQKVKFTNKTMNQKPCAVPAGQPRDAKIRDYWQFSARIMDTKNCKRSGINVTKNQFRRLGARITGYFVEKKNGQYVRPDLFAIYDAAKTAVNGNLNRDNLFMALSAFLINNKTPRQLTNVDAIVKSYVAFLEKIRTEAPQITTYIAEQEGSNSTDTAGSFSELENDFDFSDQFDAVREEDEKVKALLQ